MSFRTAFERDGAMMYEPARIARHYLEGEFKLDLLVSIPYSWMLEPLFSANNVPVAARMSALLRAEQRCD